MNVAHVAPPSAQFPPRALPFALSRSHFPEAFARRSLLLITGLRHGYMQKAAAHFECQLCKAQHERHLRKWLEANVPM